MKEDIIKKLILLDSFSTVSEEEIKKVVGDRYFIIYDLKKYSTIFGRRLTISPSEDIIINSHKFKRQSNITEEDKFQLNCLYDSDTVLKYYLVNSILNKILLTLNDLDGNPLIYCVDLLEYEYKT